MGCAGSVASLLKLYRKTFQFCASPENAALSPGRVTRINRNNCGLIRAGRVYHFNLECPPNIAACLPKEVSNWIAAPPLTFAEPLDPRHLAKVFLIGPLGKC